MRADKRREALGADFRDRADKFVKEEKIGWKIETRWGLLEKVIKVLILW